MDEEWDFKEKKRAAVKKFEKRFLAELMRAHEGNVTDAAESAGILRSALQRHLRNNGIKSESFR
ncbi:MAG: hypothetical protein GY722_09445 [bacterium]|nr:hypothetical protein [bacterium]